MAQLPKQPWVELNCGWVPAEPAMAVDLPACSLNWINQLIALWNATN
jgi:hypothetical protein